MAIAFDIRLRTLFGQKSLDEFIPLDEIDFFPIFWEFSTIFQPLIKYFCFVLIRFSKLVSGIVIFILR